MNENVLLQWDQDNERLYETGVSHGVLYVKDENGYGDGVAWNGLTAVNEAPEGGEANPLYADDIKYLNLLSNEDYKATIEAYTYPDAFAACDGSAELVPGVYAGQQDRKTFGFSYVTKIGNDTEGSSHGYKIHLVYNCLAAPSDKNYETINDNPDAITFSWEVSTTPVAINSSDPAVSYKPTAHLVIDSTKFTTTAAKAKLAAFELKLWGSPASGSGQDVVAEVKAKLPLPDEVITDLTVSG